MLCVHCVVWITELSRGRVSRAEAHFEDRAARVHEYHHRHEAKRNTDGDMQYIRKDSRCRGGSNVIWLTKFVAVLAMSTRAFMVPIA